MDMSKALSSHGRSSKDSMPREAYHVRPGASRDAVIAADFGLKVGTCFQVHFWRDTYRMKVLFLGGPRGWKSSRSLPCVIFRFSGKSQTAQQRALRARAPLTCRLAGVIADADET
jgi:hypothetical protein